MSNILVLDANVLLEILEIRRLYSQVLETLTEFGVSGHQLAISSLTVSNTFYLAERHKVPMERVEKLIAQYLLFDILKDDITWALAHYGGHDFEDALQIAAALREGCTTFLTLDAGLAKKYSPLPLDIRLIN